jgi:GTP cyclohydrolase FolE2
MTGPCIINNKSDISVVLLRQLKKMDEACVTKTTHAGSDVKFVVDLGREISG